jgi:hypothetical protein
MYEVIFDRNGAKSYVKIYEFFLWEKSANRGFMKSSSHSSTASGSVKSAKVSKLYTY